MSISLSLNDFAALSPLLILLGGALSLLLQEAFVGSKGKKVGFGLTLMTLILASYAVVVSPRSTNPLLSDWIRFDTLSKIFSLLFIFTALGTAFLSSSFFWRFESSEGEYYFLLLASVFGLVLVGSAADFLTLFLGLETLSISLYVLCGYMKKWEISHESAIKYFLTGAIATGIFLYGIALVYGAVGFTHFDALLSAYKSLGSGGKQNLFLTGIALITLGFAFKAAIVPLHVWAPDVYAGAPNPVTAFMAVGTKAGAFAAFAIVFLKVLPHFNLFWNYAVASLACITLIYANFVALRQIHLRRFFAYSGISHAGFLLIPIVSQTPDALTALLFYLTVYSIATLGMFSALAFLDRDSDGVVIGDLKGLFQRSPWLAVLISLCLLTLAGIPPTVGFVAKFYLFKVGIEAGYYGLVIIALLTTILSAYYYLRITSVMFTEAPVEDVKPQSSWPALVLGGISLIFLITLSFYPLPLLNIFT